jgi:hypothetical protein
MREPARPFLSIALAAFLLAACAGPGSSGDEIRHPTGDSLILRVSYSGGLAGPMFDQLEHPVFSLMGDGRVIVPGAVDAMFPRRALPAQNVRTLTEAGIQAVLAEVAATGLFMDDIEYRGAQNCVMDASDVIFTLHADDRDVTVKVFGLGTLDPAVSCPGVTAAEYAAHAKLMILQDRLMNPDGWLPAGAWADAWEPYQPEAMRLVVRNADNDEPDGSGIPNPLVPWPSSSDPATFGGDGGFGQRCGVVSGDEADEWYALLEQANQLTRFTRDEHRYAVQVRFLLPDEPAECLPPIAF